MGKAIGAIGCLGGVLVLVAGLVMTLMLGMGGALSGQSGDDAAETATTADATCITSGATGGIPPQYQDAVEDAADEAGLPVSILHALFTQESGYDEDAVSDAGAGGIAQFMPATWAEYGNGGDRFNAFDGIAASGRFLAALQDMITDVASNDVEQIEFTLAAYNAGPGAVQQYNGITPYPETQNYVQIIMGNADVDYSEDCTERAGSVVGDLGTGEWTHPLPGGRSTSGFGPRPCPAEAACNEYTTNHHGLDFSTGGGTEIIAPTDIKVTATGTNQFQGEYVVGRMTDEAELVFQFHHCQSGSTSVTVGDTVAVGSGLCTEGNTGNSSGAHLHFQINLAEADDSQPTYDHATDPEPILQEQGIL